MLFFAKMYPWIQLPMRKTIGSAGLDLPNLKRTIVEPFGKAMLETGLLCKIPFGYYGRIAPRSGYSWKHHVSISAGVIDCDYRGEIKVVLFNHDPKNRLIIQPNDCVAQLVIEKIDMSEPVEICQSQIYRVQKRRNSDGFGSTGN